MSTPSVLEAILARKAEDVAALRTSQGELTRRTRDVPPPRGFRAALNRHHGEQGIAVIAEVKAKSPSAGTIVRTAHDPAGLASAYEAGGAAALSVLTDGPAFGGALDDLITTAEVTRRPRLRKDFLIDPLQVVEARAYRADAVLIIMAAVEDTQAGELLAAAQDLGMDALVEVHDERELDRALGLDARMIGVNARNLHTFSIDTELLALLAPRVPAGTLLVAESAIKTPDDVRRAAADGAHACLVGTALAGSSDPAAATRNLAQALRSPT